MFKTFAPGLHRCYEKTLEEVLTKDPTLRTPYNNTAFACTTINFGPRVVTVPHRDHLNLAYGWCSITALGKFNPQEGGHLVLPELKLAIEFPPGATIFIPSAMFTHYNLPIEPFECRRTITQFSAGGLWRWVSYGHQQKGVATAEGVTPQQWWDPGQTLYDIWPVNKAHFVELDSRAKVTSDHQCVEYTPVPSRLD